jgi:hypothetical protein
MGRNDDDDYDEEINRRRAMTAGSRKSIGQAGPGKRPTSAFEGDTQTVLLRTFENFYQQESETLITTLEESRDDIKNSMLELCLEQERCKEELYRLSDGRYNFRRKKGKFNYFPNNIYKTRKFRMMFFVANERILSTNYYYF